MDPKPSNASGLPPSVDSLTLEELLSLFAGRDAWHFPGVERLGIPDLQVTDCGHGVTLVAPPFGSATCFPTSIGMAATWNRELLREVGQALGRETRSKGCGMLLGPMVNLHRVPCGGRNYETFSEDPVLTARLAAAWVDGLQSEGTAACVKSYLCNNQQRNQKHMSSDVDTRTLREIYLKVYRLILEEVTPWAIMTSYNPVNGTPPSDSSYWIKTVLRGELGYDGVVVSDWHSIHDDSALFSDLDIEMPGPGNFLIPGKFKKALAAGQLSEEELKKRARRLLDLHAKVAPARLGDNRFSPPELDSPRHRELARRVAEESIVLLKNRNAVLPLDGNQLKRIAVIGPNAASARLGGGGSASVHPFYAVSPLEGIRAAVSDAVEVSYLEGCSLGNDLPVIPPSALRPDKAATSGEGLKGEYFIGGDFDQDTPATVTQTDPMIDFSWGWASPVTGLPRNDYSARWSGWIRSPRTGLVTIALSTHEGVARMWLDDELVLDCWSDHDPSNFEDRYTNRQASANVSMETDKAVRVIVEYKKTGTRAGLRLGWALPDAGDEIENAARLGAASEVAIVCVGLSNMFEGGNCDRREFELPGRQEALIRAVAAANPRTIVILNNGTPVSFEAWQDPVAAILEAFYPGQEGGTAVANILFGKVNPSGRLPDTLPRSWEQVPAQQTYANADDHRFEYAEGLAVGYRHFDAARIDPAFPFGFGLSYTSFHYDHPELSALSLAPGEQVEISTQITNTGKLRGCETAQLYLEPIEPDLPTPPAALLDFSKINLEPGERKTVSFQIHYRDLMNFDPKLEIWRLCTHRFRLRIGPHSRAGNSVELTRRAQSI